MNWISWPCFCASVLIEKDISPYIRVQRVKVLDVFCGNPRGIIFGRSKSARFWNCLWHWKWTFAP